MRGFFALLLCPAALCAQQPVRNPRTSPDDIAAGAKTFRSHCAPCHGYNAEGSRGPNLASGQFHHGGTDADLLNNISNGIPGTEMPSLFYSPDRIWQIVAYLRSLHPAPEGLAGDKTRGAALFQAKGCANCHRIAGQGGAMGPDLSEIGSIRSPAHLRQSIEDPDAAVLPRYWRAGFKDAAGNSVTGFVMNEDSYSIQVIDSKQKLHSYRKAGLSDFRIDKRSAMPSYRASLAPAEITDLVAYLASMRQE